MPYVITTAYSNMNVMTRLCGSTRRTQMESEEENASEGGQETEPLLCAASEAQEAMADFEAALNDNDGGDVNAMIESLNEDQLRVFETVKNSVHTQCLSSQAQNTKPLRMFVSGCGDTGKSYLIKAIKAWVSSATDKHVAITAPTGIAAFSINGLTIHRLLQLPVEHGKTPQYRPLTDESLKVVRQRLENLILLVIDEISMVSHITLLYIHSNRKLREWLVWWQKCPCVWRYAPVATSI